jgi:SAM-dependent methyltransferase
MHYDPSSRARLNLHDLPRFTEATLFHRVARVLCAAECLPRRELFESWEVARRARRRLRGTRVVDLACGHGLIAHLMMLLDPAIELAVAADRRLPPSAGKVAAALAERWPRLQGRVSLVESPIAEVQVRASDIVVSCHACGPLTDRVLDSALGAMAPVAVLPCCQASASGDAGGLDGWLDNALAIDVTRAARLRAHGYRVHTQHIPLAMTAKNRLLLGEPPP